MKSRLPADSKANKLERRIIEGVRNQCSQHLATLQRDGVPADFLTIVATMIATKKLDLMPEELKEAFRDRAYNLKGLSAIFKKEIKILRLLRPQPTADIEHKQLAAKAAEDSAREIGKLLNRYRSDRDQGGFEVLVKGIFVLNKDFNSWPALQHVLAVAYEEAGLDPPHLSADMLRMTGKRAQVSEGDVSEGERERRKQVAIATEIVMRSLLKEMARRFKPRQFNEVYDEIKPRFNAMSDAILSPGEDGRRIRSQILAGEADKLIQNLFVKGAWPWPQS